MFEKAARQKLRFTSVVGQLTAEDLWDLPFKSTRINVPSLNDVARGLNTMIKEGVEDDFISDAPSRNRTLDLKMDIVKHVIAVKLTDQETATKTAATRAKNILIHEIIDQKGNEALLKKSVTQLEKMLQDEA
jgi:hypothetical protein